jgi:hypothetical protein
MQPLPAADKAIAIGPSIVRIDSSSVIRFRALIRIMVTQPDARRPWRLPSSIKPL